MKEFFNHLKEAFANKEYAHSYLESHAVSRLAAQIHALRKQRDWSQEELSLKTGIAQERISKIESANFDSLTMKTLQKFSRAFDVNLRVAFEPVTYGILDVANLNCDQLEVKPREEDLATSFTDNTVFVQSKGEWKAINHLRPINNTISRQPLHPRNDWQNLGTPAPVKVAVS